MTRVAHISNDLDMVLAIVSAYILPLCRSCLNVMLANALAST